MEWTGWQVEPSASVSNHPNFANAECCRSKLKDALLGCLQEEDCCGCCTVGLGSDLLWDTMRLYEILNVIEWHWMHVYVYIIMFVSTMRNPVGLCICISEDRHSIASPRVSCKARNGDTSSLRSSNSGLCWRRPWPCFSGHVSTSFGFAKSLKSPKMEALTPLTAILTREQVGRAEKIEPAPWISDQASSSRIPWCCYTPSLSSHLAVCLFAWFAYGIWPVQKFLPSILRQSQRLHWVQDDLGDPACQSFTRRDVSTEGMSFSP